MISKNRWCVVKAAHALLGSPPACGLMTAAPALRNNPQSAVIAYKLGLPARLTVDDLIRWLGAMAVATQPHRLALVGQPAVSLEVMATKAGIAHYLIIKATQRRQVLASLRAAMPIRLEEAPDYLHHRPHLRRAAELRLITSGGTLAADRAAAASAAYLASMHPLHRDEQVVVQLTATGAPWSSSTSDGKRMSSAERHPRLRLALRIGVAATQRARAGSLLHGVLDGLRVLNTPGAALRRRHLPSWLVADRLTRRATPLVAWPLTLTAPEAAGLLGMAPGVPLPGLTVGTARQLPPPPDVPRSGCVVAMSNYPGARRHVALGMADRLMHSYVVGPTGSGKSTLLVNMALQDAASGRGVVFIDPKGDAIPDFLARLHPTRDADVVVLDPAAVNGPVVGWNLLQSAPDELARELAVDFTVHVLHELWRGSWGPRTAEVLRAALLTLTHTVAADGSAFTIVDLPELLTNDGLRRFVLRQPGVPASVRSFWQEFEARSESDRTAVIGPTMNKIRAFGTRTPLRLILGQSQSIDLRDVFTKRRILLVPLSPSLVGPETSRLLGALVVSGIWQACLSRIAIPPELRRPVVCYVDEVQELVRLPLPLEDMLAQARGLSMAMVMANQSLTQLPTSMRSAVLGVARTQIAFQVGHQDARLLAPSFGPLDAEDLRHLAAHEVAIRACVHGRTLTPVTGSTLPLPAANHDARALADASRQAYGQERAAIEAALAARVMPGPPVEIGRVRRWGQA
jgi:hypothetical protein